MLSVKQLHELVVLFFNRGLIDEADFLLLYSTFNPQNLELPYGYPAFDFVNKDEDECLSEFRFTKIHIERLAQALQIPAVITCYQGTICDGIEGLCMLLRRLAYPCRYADMVQSFAKLVPVICMITTPSIALYL